MVVEASLRLARDNLVIALIARIIGRNKSEIGKYFLITKYFIGIRSKGGVEIVQRSCHIYFIWTSNLLLSSQYTPNSYKYLKFDDKDRNNRVFIKQEIKRFVL